MSFAADWLSEVASIALKIDVEQIEACAELLNKVKSDQGRVFVIGVGGSAANASHFVNDLRKIAGVEAYAPTDNAAELTARTNDDGWWTVFLEWLRTSHMTADDLLVVLSVSGGTETVSPNIVHAVEYARERKAKIMGVVGSREGYTARAATSYVLVPAVNQKRVTPHVESFQSVLGHLLVWYMSGADLR